MHILCAIHLAGALNISVRRSCLADEALEAFLTFGMTLDGLNDKAVRGPPRLAGERSNSSLELRGQLHGCSVSGHTARILLVTPK